jgi:cell division protein FtsQ
MFKPKNVLVFFVFLIACGVLGFQLSKIPYIKKFIQINVVKVKGTDRLTKEDVVKIFQNQNWIFLDEKQIEEKIKKQFPFIKQIKIEKGMNEVKLFVLEREPFAILKTKKGKYIVDDEGFILNYYQVKNKEYPVIIYKDKIINPKKVHGLMEISKIISKLYKPPIKFVVNSRKITCITENDKIFVFDFFNYKKELEKFKVFAKKVDINKYKYLDFSFDSMVVSRK